MNPLRRGVSVCVCVYKTAALKRDYSISYPNVKLDLFNRMRDCLPENIVGKRYDMPVNPGHESATFVI